MWCLLHNYQTKANMRIKKKKKRERIRFLAESRLKFRLCSD